MEWKNIYRGMIMGASDIVSGVSGGTIAVLLGIYDQFIGAINGIFSRDWKKHLSFLVPLAIGVAAAILTLGRIMDWLLKNYPSPTFYFFLGLIIGILPLLFRESNAKTTFKLQHILLLIAGFILVGLLAFFKDPNEGAVIVDKTMSTYVLLFFSGVLASAAMILPGISGSLVFLIMGVFPTVMAAITNFEILTMAIIAAGIFIGIMTISKIIHFFLKRYHTGTFAVIIGSVIGSIVVIFPGWPISIPYLFVSIATFAVGLFVAYILGKVEYEE